ncbi:PepSY domain-containing protein [Parapedobacter sp. DT-150]|uniref:PepSY-associated TM helix domain-containing protein n=1 Tax=Parapedobacter sp. DT-150 TaxID=3396162 RepID=UPI003F1C8828
MSKRADKVENNKKLFWRLHHWVGLYTGILIGILSLTGAVAVFIPEIDALIVKHHYNAISSPSPTGTPQFGRSVDSLIHRYPDYTSLSISMPDHPGDVVQVDLILQPEGGEPRRTDFFIDAGNDRVIGQRDHQNSLANYLRQMHVRLYEGYWGRQLVGIGGLALAVVAITGLLIYGNFMKKQRWPQLRKTMDMRIIMADWHKLLGVSALAFNMVIALTGAWLGLQPWLMRWFDITTPNTFKAPTVMEADADKAMHIDWNEALHTAKKEFPDLQPRQLSASTNGSAAITLRGNIAGQIYERNINVMVISKTAYTPIFKYDVRRQPFGHKFYFIQEALHFGDFGGFLLKALYAILGLTSGFLSISGFVIFLLRRQKKKKFNRTDAWKTTFVYSMIVLLFLISIALVSLFIGYAPAASLAGMIINTLLIVLIGYALFRYLFNRFRRKQQPAA